jgi:peptidoglycan/xylan/chitin deacetylase (PgdA/CDA1 family)
MDSRQIIFSYFLGVTVCTPILIFFNLGPVAAGLWVWAGFLFFYPATRPNISWFGPISTSFQTEQREVWLTIDDGPDPEDTPQILDILQQHQARATFFLIGKKVEQYPELVAEMVRRGHTIGNHSYSHPVATFWMATPAQIAWELDTCAQALASVVPEVTTVWFRAPVGMANWFVEPALRRRGLHLTGWSARGYDALETNPSVIVERVWKDVKPGAIILLHEGHHHLGVEAVNPRSLALLLERLKTADYSCVVPRSEQLLEGRKQ